MWFSGFDPIIRILLVGSSSYLALLVMLRIAGARSLAKFNAFDFAVTVAVGSMLATAVTSKDLAFTSGAAAIALMLGLQFLVARVIRDRLGLRKLVTASPVVLVRAGQLLPEGLKAARLGQADVRQAARQAGLGSFENIAAMILETDGTISTVTFDQLGDGSTLDDLPDLNAVGAQGMRHRVGGAGASKS
ncbi:DUF421 domain-containing protein [Corynebacterium gerontici]|uniref:YetF C-terminal domain-containing protein n=1 Tax=Corynebacterium gerontici TaxID=2079234 RepID=A0A3G6J1C8_9CORY|nr:YetF domain-containing protein [Corynebacterium gerontici]AZA11825.1 hypothetical protein CGERO_07625 [Corynebacterium gerontici]